MDKPNALETTNKKPAASKGKKKEKKNIKLIIVESPAKAKTINKYLGKNYKVISCMGHVIDLPKSRMAIDIENGFKPDYITVRGKGKVLQDIKRHSKDCAEVYLAPDPDREGEAIAHLLKQALRKKYSDLPIKRVVFNEITKDIVRQSINEPKEINSALVNAQKARRILDRIVGYNISPLLWEKLKKGLSAGRVQSVTLNIICTREEEILNFKPTEYWTLNLQVGEKGKKKRYECGFISLSGEKLTLDSKEVVDKILNEIEGKPLIITSVNSSNRKRNPLPPYTTSKLQQEAATRFGFSSAKTMMIAQRLYEGLNIGSESTGLITYMRTDSVRVSEVAIKDVREYISHYLPGSLANTPHIYKTGKNAQDAHEAIRPTVVRYTPDYLKEYLSRDEFKIYSIIWERFVSSQMKAMEFSNVKVTIKAGEALFGMSGSVVVDKGFSQVFKMLKIDSKAVKLPAFKEGEELDLHEVLPKQHFTKPPPRYSDASIIKVMEESGIGRPSTYAPTVERIIRKYYVRRVKRQLVPTVLGTMVNKVMEDHFTYLLETSFTSVMEEHLDDVASQKIEWVKVLEDFYPHFIEVLEAARKNIAEMKNFLDEETNIDCPECGKKLIKKLGKFGFFLACSGFPDCRHTESISLGDCPKEGCSGKIIARKTKKGRDFYGCNKYPSCEFLSWDPPIEEKCPDCGNVLFETGSKKKGYFNKCLNEACGYTKKVEHDE